MALAGKPVARRWAVDVDWWSLRCPRSQPLNIQSYSHVKHQPVASKVSQNIPLIHHLSGSPQITRLKSSTVSHWLKQSARLVTDQYGYKWRHGVTDVSRTITFPDRRFPDNTFPGRMRAMTRRLCPIQDVSRTTIFPDRRSFPDNLYEQFGILWNVHVAR